MLGLCWSSSLLAVIFVSAFLLMSFKPILSSSCFYFNVFFFMCKVSYNDTLANEYISLSLSLSLSRALSLHQLLSVFPLCLQLHQFAAVRDTTVVRSVLEQAMAQTRTNIAWLRDNYDTIRDWLANRGATLPPPAAGSYRFGSQFLLFCFVVWYGPNFKHWFTTSFLQPLTTSYAIGSRKLSANEQCFLLLLVLKQ